MTRRSMFLFAALAFVLVACNKGSGGGNAQSSKYPGTEEGAKQLLNDIRLSPDAKAMTLALKPTSADYKAVFVGDAAAKAEASYDKLWSDPKTVIKADPANTDLLLFKATTEELQKWPPEVDANFPGGYKRVGDKFKPGFTVYRWKYAKPGEKLGMAFDGLIYVGDHWAWFPKPWRAVGDTGAPGAD